MFGHSHIQFQKLPQPTKTKMQCPVTFTRKKILRFPDFYIKKDTKKNRDEASKQLREHLANIAKCKLVT